MLTGYVYEETSSRKLRSGITHVVWTVRVFYVDEGLMFFPTFFGHKNIEDILYVQCEGDSSYTTS